jgi:hypothetical protein
MAIPYRLLVAALLVLSIPPSAARADPIALTAGSLNIAWDDPSSFRVFGAGFELSGLFVGVTSSPQRTCFAGCLPGTVLNLSAVAGDPFGLGTATTAVVNGFDLTDPFQPQTWLSLTGSFVFDAGNVVLPALTPVGTGPIMSTAPFTFRGQVSGASRADPLTTVLNVELTGQGTATFRANPQLNGTFGTPEVTYTFEELSPVPEPGTILLVTTGVAGVVLRRRRSPTV